MFKMDVNMVYKTSHHVFFYKPNKTNETLARKIIHQDTIVWYSLISVWVLQKNECQIYQKLNGKNMAANLSKRAK